LGIFEILLDLLLAILTSLFAFHFASPIGWKFQTKALFRIKAIGQNL